MKVSEFEDKLSQLTASDLQKINDNLRHEYFEQTTSPLWDTGGTKPKNIRNFTYWVKGHPDRIKSVLDAVDAQITLSAQLPRRGAVPGTRYVNIRDLQNLKSLEHIGTALNHCSNPNKKCEPFTSDGNITVAALYNMSAWANWKSSSLSSYDREVAREIDNLKLHVLMKLNHGRRSNEPALFPQGLLA